MLDFRIRLKPLRCRTAGAVQMLWSGRARVRGLHCVLHAAKRSYWMMLFFSPPFSLFSPPFFTFSPRPAPLPLPYHHLSLAPHHHHHLSLANKRNQFTEPAPTCPQGPDQSAFAHTVKAPVPSLSLGVGLIYNLRWPTWDRIEQSLASHRGARGRVCVRAQVGSGRVCT
jgi:hypothetical protein